jgi:predicted transcriptional regulator
MVTFLELFARAYMSPQEISEEASVPLETVYRLRAGRPVSERDVRRVLRVVNSRLEKPVLLSELPVSQIQWE